MSLKQRLNQVERKLSANHADSETRIIVIRDFGHADDAVLIGYRPFDEERLWPADPEQWPPLAPGSYIGVKEVWSDDVNGTRFAGRQSLAVMSDPCA